MTPRLPTTLLDASFLHALADPSAARHDEVVSIYRELLDEFVDDRRRLLGLSDHLGQFSAEQRQSTLAPVRALHVAGQHRRAAEAMARDHAIPLDVALVLVLVRRERVRSVATLDERFARFELELVPAPAQRDVDSDAQLSN